MTTWSLSNSAKAQRLERAFSNRDIDFRTQGFCDHPNFLRAEASDPRFLESYAEYVEVRPYTTDYLEDARCKITVAAEAVRLAVAKDGRLGACVDVASMLGRMLDRLGVWNYNAKTCLTIHYPDHMDVPDTYFYGVDTNQFTAPHAIIVAPPFCVVDVSAKYQPFRHPRQSTCIPERVLQEQFISARWNYSDIASPEVQALVQFRGGHIERYLRSEYGSMYEVAAKLPARMIEPASSDSAALKYVIVAVGGVIEPLEGVLATNQVAEPPWKFSKRTFSRTCRRPLTVFLTWTTDRKGITYE